MLDKAITPDGMKSPKWNPCSTCCVYLGVSPKYASNVPLVLNPASGAITVQFHVVLDDWFATVASNCESLPNFNDDAWMKMFGDSVYQYVIESYIEEEPSISDSVDHFQATNHQNQLLQPLTISSHQNPSLMTHLLNNPLLLANGMNLIFRGRVHLHPLYLTDPGLMWLPPLLLPVLLCRGVPKIF